MDATESQKKMTNKIRFKLDGGLLPPIAGIAQAVLFSVAGDIYFDRWYIGLITGIIPSLALAFGASRLAGVSSKRRRILGTVMLVLVLLVSPIVVAPALFMELSGNNLPPALLWVVASGWASLPDLSVVFAATVAGASLFSLKAEEPPAQATTPPAPSEPKRKPCEWCGKLINNTQNARNAHTPHCKVLQVAARE